MIHFASLPAETTDSSMTHTQRVAPRTRPRTQGASPTTPMGAESPYLTPEDRDLLRRLSREERQILSSRIAAARANEAGARRASEWEERRPANHGTAGTEAAWRRVRQRPDRFQPPPPPRARPLPRWGPDWNGLLHHYLPNARGFLNPVTMAMILLGLSTAMTLTNLLTNWISIPPTALFLLGFGAGRRPRWAPISLLIITLIMSTEAAPTLGTSPNPSTGPRSDVPRPKDHTLTTFYAYDCTRPSIMTPVHPQENIECPTELPKPVTRREATVVVLQEAEYQRISGTRCDYTESRLPYYCGTYDHVTIEGDGFRIQEPRMMTARKCLDLAATQRLKLGAGFRDIPKNVRTQVTYYKRGRTVYYSEHHIGCLGGTYTHPDPDHIRKYKAVTDLRVADILVQDITLAIADDGTVTEQRDRITLPTSCKVEKGYCFTPTGNYVWEQPRTAAAQCKLYKTREVKGEFVTDAKGSQAFVATDGTALHLLLTGKKYKCGQEVHTTNHKKIFLTEETTAEPFQRELDSSEMSVAMFSSAQTQFSEHHVAKYVEEMMLQLQADRCLGRKNQRTPLDLLAAGQTALANGDTMSLGSGKFATARGEAYYTYECAQVEANALSKDRCFDGLPVSISPADRRAHFKARGEVDDPAATFYLEPKSHILLTDAAPRECMPQMAPLWQNAAGSWISAAPTVVAAPAPAAMTPTHSSKAIQPFKGTDYGLGGLYTASQIRVMDKERQLPNRIHDIEITMAGRSSNSGWRADAKDGSIISDDVLDMSRAWYINPADWIWARIQEIGHLGSILVATSMIVKLFTWITGVIMRFYYGEPIGPAGTMRHLAMTLFPSAVLMFDRWEQNRIDNARIRRQLLQQADAPAEPSTNRNSARMHVAGGIYPALEMKDMKKTNANDTPEENAYSNADGDSKV